MCWRVLVRETRNTKQNTRETINHPIARKPNRIASHRDLAYRQLQLQLLYTRSECPTQILGSGR